MTTRLQAKLTVGASGDRYEQEADRVAEAVTRPDAPQLQSPLLTMSAMPAMQRACAACTPEDENVRGKPSGSSLSLPVHLTERVIAARTGGAPLPAAARAFFEPRFGRDFGDVRLHTDPAAATTSRALGARAYTIGHDIVFAPGEFALGTSDGRKLLAHELTHVVQQGLGSAGTPDVQRDDTKQKRPAPIKWKIHYDTRDEAKLWVERLRRKGITVEEPIQEKEGFTFVIDPMSEAEAVAAAAEKAKAAPTHAVSVEHEKLPRGGSVPYVRDIPKCPDSIAAAPPAQVWSECFKTAREANALKAKFDRSHIKAEIVQVTDTAFGLRFVPMTQADAEAAGKAAAKARSVGADDVPFSVTTPENKALHSFTFNLQATCPPGFNDLGTFELTAYWVSQEKDFPEGPTESDPSLPRRKFRKGFLTSTTSPFFGVKKEGSGRALNGDLVNFSNDKFTIDPCPRDARGGCLKVGESVAVAKDIPIGTSLLIEGVGTRTAADHGEAVGSHHIDVFFGETLPVRDAFKLTFFQRKVCQKRAP